MAVLITSSSIASLRNRYSVTPSHILNSFLELADERHRKFITYRSGADHMFVWIDTQFPPTIDHSKKTQMVVRRSFSRQFREWEPIKDFVLKKQSSACIRFENCCTCGLDPVCQLFTMTTKHELVKLSNGLWILLDLLLSRGIQYCKASVNMPFVWVDAKSNIDLDILDATNISVDLPWKLIVCCPSRAHT